MLQSQIFNCTNMYVFAIHEYKIIVEISEIKVHVFRKLETKQGNMNMRCEGVHKKNNFKVLYIYLCLYLY